jgi:murein L,D-transpeptidase YafK
LVALAGGLLARGAVYLGLSLRTVPAVGHAAPAPAGDLLPTNRPPSIMPASMPDSPDRVADARKRRADALAAKFAAAGLAYPPREIFLRAFKQEGELELWARADARPSARFRLVSVYPVLAGSGWLGPKRQEGDRQIPEGFYVIERFNPRSLFHLSLGLNYPNASDRRLTTDPQNPGSDIYIHGAAASIGCLAMGDPAIEEIYLAAVDARAAGQREIPAHFFPCRMTPDNWKTLLAPRIAARPDLEAFWRNLQPSYDYFEATGLPPKVTFLPDGRHAFPGAAAASSPTGPGS